MFGNAWNSMSNMVFGGDGEEKKEEVEGAQHPHISREEMMKLRAERFEALAAANAAAAPATTTTTTTTTTSAVAELVAPPATTATVESISKAVPALVVASTTDAVLLESSKPAPPATATPTASARTKPVTPAKITTHAKPKTPKAFTPKAHTYGTTPKAQRPRTAPVVSKDSGPVLPVEEGKVVWEFQTCCSLLQVTLDPDVQSATYLKYLADGSTTFGRTALKTVLFERMSLPFNNSSSLGFVVACYQRAATLPISPTNGFPRAGHTDDLLWCNELLGEVAKQLAAFAGHLLCDVGDTPAEFYHPVKGAKERCQQEFNSVMMRDSYYSRTFPEKFLQKMVASLLEEGHTRSCLKQIWGKCLAIIVAQTHPVDLAKLMPPLKALIKMCEVKQVGLWVVQQPFFMSATSRTGRQLEVQSLLGRYLSASPNGHPDLQNIRRRTPGDVEGCVESLRNEFDGYQAGINCLLRALVVKADKETRQITMAWIASTLRRNQSRRKMQFDSLAVASDAHVINLSWALLTLCKPIIKAKTPKFDAVNLEYLMAVNPPSDLQVDYSDVTRLFVTKDAEARSDQGDEYFSFVTKCIFMTLEACHVGVVRCFKTHVDSLRSIQRLQQQEQQMGTATTPMEQAMADRTTQMVDRMYSQHYCSKVHLMHPDLLSDLTDFYAWVCQWLLNLASTNHPLLKLVPEYVVEDLLETFLHLSRFRPDHLQHMRGATLSRILQFFITFVAGAKAIRNPHLRGQFPEILKTLCPDNDSNFGKSLDPGHIFLRDEHCKRRLLPALVELYVDVEFGGGEQFYSKHTTRHHLNELLEYLWDDSGYQQQFVAIASTKVWSGFANTLVNDMMYLLDESLEHLEEIRTEQLVMTTPAWGQLTENERRDRHQSFAQAEGQAAQLMQLANSTVHMLRYMTRVIVKPFLTPEFAHRMAALVDYYIVKLVGPDVSRIKVANADKYHFQPRQLLADIIGIFLHLATDPSFIEAVASDERSYQVGVFARAVRILSKKSIIPQKQVARFESVLLLVAAAATEREQEEEDLGEVPDEFLDPILSTIMRNPVVLPASGQIIDLSSIKRHLLNNPLDPFTRAPLSLDMVQPDLALKARIDAWIAEQKKASQDKREQQQDEQKQQAVDAACAGDDDELLLSIAADFLKAEAGKAEKAKH